MHFKSYSYKDLMMFHCWNVYVPGLTPLPSNTKNLPKSSPWDSIPGFPEQGWDVWSNLSTNQDLEGAITTLLASECQLRLCWDFPQPHPCAPEEKIWDNALRGHQMWGCDTLKKNPHRSLFRLKAQLPFLCLWDSMGIPLNWESPGALLKAFLASINPQLLWLEVFCSWHGIKFPTCHLWSLNVSSFEVLAAGERDFFPGVFSWSSPAFP